MKKGYQVGYFGRTTHFSNCIVVMNVPEFNKVWMQKDNLETRKPNPFEIGVWKIKK